MNAEEEEKENERNIQFILSSFTVIYVCIEEEKCQLCRLGFNVCSRRSNE